MKKLLFFLLLVHFSVFSQDEKRLALVIGNANYDKGELKNPVNDARLIAQTLDSLNFDIILKENLGTTKDLEGAIREFGEKRSDYDIAFVYYAGHGVQVDDQNFLLPTKEVFKKEFDVLDNGVSVQKIMRYLTAKTNEVNILILDACRDNPFESSWNTTRSIKGNGLAKIPPPTGSLIAFSTDSGQTAPDGDGENSIYTLSLSKNMLLEDTSIDQVFRNVRAEVLAQTNNEQRPVEATQLTGQTFYLRIGTFENEYKQIREIIDNNTDYFYGLELANVILNERPNDKEALKLSAEIYIELEEKEKALEFTNRLIELDPYYGRNNRYSVKGYIYYYLFNDRKNALINYTKAIDIDPEEAINYYNRAYYFYEEEEEWELALADCKKAQELNPDGNYFFRLAYVADQLEQYENALSYYMQYIEKDGEDPAIFNNMALIYRMDLKDYEKALEYFNKAIEMEKFDAMYYNNRAYLYYFNLNEKEKALADFTKSIELAPEDAEYYYDRAYYFYEEEEEWELALADYKKAQELNPDGDYFFRLAYVAYQLDQYETSLSYFMQSTEKNGEEPGTFNNMGVIYRTDLKEYEKALEYFNKAIEMVDNALYYDNRADLYYFNLNEKEKALADYNKAIELAPEDAEYYYNRAYYYKLEEELELALADYKKAQELNPDGNYFFELGHTATELDLYETALSYYMQYTEKYGEDPATFNNMALIYRMDLKDYEKALEYFNKAIEMEKFDAMYYNNRAYLYYFNLNEKEKALADFTKSIELAPEDAEYYYDRAYYFYEEEEEWELALADYKKAQQLNPDGDYFFRLAYVADLLDQYENALSYYMQNIEKFGGSGETYNNMALIYRYDLKEYEKALEYINKAIEMVPEDALYYNNRAIMYHYNLNEKEKALADYNKAVELAPEDSYYLDQRADFYEDEKEWELALADNIKSNQLEPNSTSSYHGISYNKIKLKQFQGAIDNYLNALNLENLENDDKYYLLKTIGATYNFGLNDFKNSKKYLEDAIDLNAENSDAYLEMGDLFAKNSENKKALEYYNKAIEVDSTDTPIYYRSIFYYRTGQYDLAFEDVKKVRNIDSTNPASYYLDFLINSELNKIKAFSDITLAIEKYEDGLEEDNSDSRWWLFKEYISFINEDRLGINDLYLDRANLYKKFGDNEQYCIELNEIQNILNSEEDQYKKLISELILESCSQ